MENFTFYTPTLYEFGRGTEEKVGMLTFLTGATRVLLVYGRRYAKNNGLIGRIENSLNTLGIEYFELGGVEPNPTDTLVYEGIKIARKNNIDGVLAVGGGSVIDTAKAIAAGVGYKGDFWDFFTGKAQVTEALPVGVVLTIPGSGSEGSGNCVITKTDGAVKLSLRTDSILRPRFAIMNPEMTSTLTAYQTAVGIVDMMSHIMERYFSNTSNVEVTDRLAEGLLMSLIAMAPRVLSDPTDYQARANVEWAGTLAHNGLVGCGRREDWVSHFMEHEISAMYPSVAHGAGLAVVIPAWMSYMAHHKPSKVAQLGRRVFGVDIRDDRGAAIETVAQLRAFFSAVLRMPSTFKGLGIDEPDIDKMVEKLHANKGETIGGYYRLSAPDTHQIYELMLDPSQVKSAEKVAEPVEA
ncbi:MAG: iron-containing alcohol dehydrogenase [Bacteroidales bacterium]|nr:iron-containing alcohol dehydrogenase [Bacteroidales bacterium]MBD5220448.1 iron-containing alcohol dehydrogenase [Bacteroidales bacterium]